MSFNQQVKTIALISVVCLLSACAGVRSRYHEVGQGETLQGIAKKFDVPLTGLVASNPEAAKGKVVAGDKLYIPFEERADWDAEGGISQAVERRVPNSVQAANGETQPAFLWPVRGNLSSFYGLRYRHHKESSHEGIDVAAPTGTPVKSARSGHVIYAGSRIKGYGNMVIVRHADKYSTVYAHLSKFKVKKGQFIGRGQLLGLVGRTGRARGAHLHFEIRDGQTPVDPMLFLPSGQYAVSGFNK